MVRKLQEERKTVVVFIIKQIIKLRLDDYARRAASILQTGKKRVKLPWMIAVRRFAFIISLTIKYHSAVRKCANGDSI
jgi:hypothetical protein